MTRWRILLKVNSTTGAVLQQIILPAGLVDVPAAMGSQTSPSPELQVPKLCILPIQHVSPDEGDIEEVNSKIGRYDIDSQGTDLYCQR